MAGDHKCPVCQSTFTRPQHVARHMRSHTGDRPYKCQHCGDQFARSDLLSRHVNKCHAAEKPPTTTAPNRRKGSAAASRATTSKQACDQCVQSSLPCDGANPCSKCLQRKCRCTYVKFHRQTAPAGPGHPVPTQSNQSGRHGLTQGSSRLPDDFILPSPQGSFGFPSLYPPNTNSNAEFAMPQASATMYPHGYPNTALDPRESAAALAISANTRDSLNDSPDALARYRAQAELLSRAGVLPNGSLAVGAPAHPAEGVIPAHTLYGDPQAQAHFNRYSISMPANTSWAQSHDTHQQQSFHAVDAQRKEYESAYATSRQSFPVREGGPVTGAGEPTLQTHPPTHGASFPPVSSSNGSSYHVQGLAFHRAEDLSDDFGSDGGSTNHSRSIPGSANSSQVHLPSPDTHNQNMRQSTYSLPGFTHLESMQNMQNGNPPSQNHNDSTNKHEYGSSVFGNDSQGEGGFSSAFGLMSLDDPNVLAGFSADSAPFFSHLSSQPGSQSNQHGSMSSLSFPTPTQDLIAAMKTGKSDMDSKEMRDFWKMYVRTPLSGPGGANALSLVTPTGTGQILGRPSPSRRHSRVASLPSMKTPPLNGDALTGPYPPSTRHNINAGHQASHGEPGREKLEDGDNAFSSMRTTLYDADDLKSYEQAVLARKTSINLNLVPKRRGTMPGGTTIPSELQHSGQNQNVHTSKSASPVVPHLPPPSSYVPNKIPDLLNRPSSTASNSSSLAHAFGNTDHSGQVQPQSRPSSQSGPQTFRPPSVESSTVIGSEIGTDSDSLYRPSFKRLASQTLGPENTKRALLGPAGWDDDAVDDDDDDDAEFTMRRSVSEADPSTGNIKYGGVADRPIVGLSDRHRRSSYPSASAPITQGSTSMQPLVRGAEAALGT